jgi:anti-anti-sigma factor
MPPDQVATQRNRNPMEIERIILGDTWEFRLSGRVDGAAANQLEIDVLAAISKSAKEILLNAEAAEWVCSAFIRVVLQYHRQMKKQGKNLLVTKPSPTVLPILEMTGFANEIIEGRQKL